ncbi:MAG: flagellar hook-length control protein FliK [Pseudomonadota bacterium]
MLPRADIITVTPVDHAEALTPLEGVADARQEAFQRSLAGLLGQSVQAEVLSKLTDGSFIVKFADTSARILLPPGAEVGSKVPLTLVSISPRPTFQISAAATSEGTGAPLYSEAGPALLPGPAGSAARAEPLVYLEGGVPRTLPTAPRPGTAAQAESADPQLAAPQDGADAPAPGLLKNAPGQGAGQPAATATQATRASAAQAQAAQGAAPADGTAAAQSQELGADAPHPQLAEHADAADAAHATQTPSTASAAAAAARAQAGAKSTAATGAQAAADAQASATEAAAGTLTDAAAHTESEAPAAVTPPRPGAPTPPAGNATNTARAGAPATQATPAAPANAATAGAAADPHASLLPAADAAYAPPLAAAASAPAPAAPASSAKAAEAQRINAAAAALLGKAPLTPANMLPALDPNTTPASLSDTARVLASVLGAAQKSENPRTTIVARAPLVGADGVAAEPLARALQDAVGKSGLFYESHVAEWASGQRSLADLRGEPQMQNQAAPASQAGEAAPHARASDPATAQFINLQLITHEQERVAWQGQAWPGQPMQWEISRDAPERQGAHEGGEPAPTWRSGVRFRFAALGEVAATVVLRGDQLHIALQSDGGDTLAELRAQAGALAASLEAAGSPLSSLTIDARASAPEDGDV